MSSTEINLSDKQIKIFFLRYMIVCSGQIVFDK